MLKSSALSVNNRIFNWGARTYVMGILNVTEDSFSGDGLLEENGSTAGQGDLIAAALDQAR